MSFKPTLHPVWRVPSAEEIRRYAQANKMRPADAFAFLMNKREERIRDEMENPYLYGWEPGIWKVCDALLGFPCFDPVFEERIQRIFDWTWDQYCKAMREFLGFKNEVRVLLATGTNRSSKTEWMAKRTMQLLDHYGGVSAWCYSQNSENSRDIQQSYIWKYMPKEYRDLKTKVAYVNYSEQNGFTDSKGSGHFVLPNVSKCSFRNYCQDVRTAEGGQPKLINNDEMITPDFQEALEGRIASTDGWLVDTFTPMDGYTPVVAGFVNSAETAKESVAFLLPADGGDPDEARAYGFESKEEMERAHNEQRWSLPEDPLMWLTGERSQPEAPKGRRFEILPRVQRCFDSRKAIVYFHPMDNPFGRPQDVYATWKNATLQKRKERLYGVATKLYSGQFPRFSDYHVIPYEKIPKEGTNYLIIDPTPGGRPFFMGWFRVTKYGAFMLFDWPRKDPWPGAGGDVPWGIWAEPSGAKNGINDGKRGPGQDGIGWGVRQYVEEIARVEGWNFSGEKVRVDDDEGGGYEPAPGGLPGDVRRRPSILRKYIGEEEEVVASPLDGAKMRVHGRFIDCRAATHPKMENERVTTIRDDFEDYGLRLDLCPGNDITDRVNKINTMLDYELDKDGKVLRDSYLKFSNLCGNTIYCMENWLNVDGTRGATKDPVDVVGYFACLDLSYVEEGAMMDVGGGYV